MNWDLLYAHFSAKDVDFRPGATTKDKTKAIGLAYVDKRVYEDRLDQFVGPENWSVEYRAIGEKAIICRLTIYGIVREDVGEYTGDDLATYPTAVAQAFKRACSAFGLGRYLYSLPQVWAEYDADKRRFTDSGIMQLKKSLNMKHDVPVSVQREKKMSTPIASDQRQRIMQRVEMMQDTIQGMGLESLHVPNDDLSILSDDELIAFGKQLKQLLDNHQYDKE